MTRKTLCSLFALGGLTLALAAVPLIAQSTQPSTASQTQAPSTKKAKSKKAKAGASSSAASTAAPASSTAAPAAQANNSSGRSAKAKAAAASSTSAAPPQKGMVWVNTASGVYHSEGTKYYGKTKQGKYMTEADAQKAGYHAAKGEKP